MAKVLMRKVGPAGFLLKQTSSHVVCEAIREIQKGNTFFCPSLVKRIHDRARNSPRRAGSAQPRNAALSSREMEVLQLIAEGKTNSAIAQLMKISVKTVEKHRASLMAKLKVHDMVALVRIAIKHGLVSLDT